ncbi:M60 family metallopeptidase [Paludibacter sp. 221]|uniref:M60 family metallopeptidase n=1 Tax=Paludibacter sp. 221 TaxID=2302939 RepID=UPI0013D6CECA|nr:M60 family metallopeptidase [Paludibacter sp. 221]
MKKLLPFLLIVGLLAACSKVPTSTSPPWDYNGDVKITVVSGNASEHQPGENIDRSFDGDLQTLYHSSWRGARFPISLTYNFNAADTLDYIIYYPRTDGVNGNFIEFELWTKTATDEDYEKVGDYNFQGRSEAGIIELPESQNNIQSVRFVVKSGLGYGGLGFVSCAEMEFYKRTPKNPIPEVFTDGTCSALKKGVSKSDIRKIENTEYRELASALYYNTYPLEERVREYKAYPHPYMVAMENKSTPYSLLDNPTGIYTKEGDELYIFVGELSGESIVLLSLNMEKDFVFTSYYLREGLNKITAKDEGLLYVINNSAEEDAKPVKIHFATGRINGVFDIAKHTNADWERMLNSATSPYMDVLGKYSHLTYAVSDFKKYTPDIEELVSVYDSIVWLESEFIGLNKYHRANKNRLYFYLSKKLAPQIGAFMFATWYRVGASEGSMESICVPQKLRGDAIWGPAHEVGHVNQTVGFKWVGLTEVSNNVYSMYVQHAFGLPSRLETEVLRSDFDGYWRNRYEKGFTEMVAGSVSHMKHGDVFCKLIPFWQLELYNSQVNGQKDFYADVHEQIRTSPMIESDAEQQLQFMKICCDVAQTDFTGFFEKWGMLVPMKETIEDLSSIQGKVNYSRSFTITQKQVDDLKRYARKYKKPVQNIQYIHDGNVEMFKTDAAIVKGEVKWTGNAIDITDWQNVAVYEVYYNGKPLLVTPFPSISFRDDRDKNLLAIYAIPVKGAKVRVH